jgi:hypothetical protein
MYFVIDQETPMEQFNKYVDYFATDLPKGFAAKEELQHLAADFKQKAEAFKQTKGKLTDKHIIAFLDFLMTFKQSILELPTSTKVSEMTP